MTSTTRSPRRPALPDARIEVSGAPFVIVGNCDGRGFYLRERHGSYRVTIAPDDDAASDPWSAGVSKVSIDVASGDEARLAVSHTWADLDDLSQVHPNTPRPAS